MYGAHAAMLCLSTDTIAITKSSPQVNHLNPLFEYLTNLHVSFRFEFRGADVTAY